MWMSLYIGMGKRQVGLGVTEKTERSVLGEKWRWGVRLYSRQEVCCVVKEQEESWGREIESLVVNQMEIMKGLVVTGEVTKQEDQI